MSIIIINAHARKLKGFSFNDLMAYINVVFLSFKETITSKKVDLFDVGLD